MRIQPKLLTKNLTLQGLQPKDAQALFLLRSNPEVNNYIARKPPLNIEEIDIFIKNKNKDIQDGKILYWGISQKNAQQLIGTICLWNFDDINSIAEIGYELHPDFHGKGIMSEAIVTILDYGFNTLKLDVIEAFTNQHNEGSLKLLEKFNFKLDASRKDKDVPENLILIKTND